MPTYEYQCKSCGHRFDLVQKIGEPPPESCPECQSGPIQKLFTAVGIIFKGSGFHVNDYRKPEPKTEESTETGAKPETKAEPAEKTETKADPSREPATKSEPSTKPESPSSEPTKSEA